MMGALADDAERALIIERTRAGHEGRQGAGHRDQPRAQLVQQGESPSPVARPLKVGRWTHYRALNQLQRIISCLGSQI
jgi:hypothetical protein